MVSVVVVVERERAGEAIVGRLSDGSQTEFRN